MPDQAISAVTGSAWAILLPSECLALPEEVNRRTSPPASLDTGLGLHVKASARSGLSSCVSLLALCCERRKFGLTSPLK